MLRRLFTTVAAGAAVFAVVSSMPAAKAESDDEAAIRATIQHYFDSGMETRKAFWPDAQMIYMRDGELNVVPIQDYLARVEERAGEPRTSTTEKRVVTIDYAGTAAVAKLELKGEDWMLYDYMSLLKIDGDWKIVNKIFSSVE